MQKYRDTFMDKLKFSGSQRCYAYSIVICCPRNHVSKNQMNMIITTKIVAKKVKNKHVWKRVSDNDYGVAMLTKSYLTVAVISMPSFKSREKLWYAF